MRLVFISSVTAMTPLRTISVTTASVLRRARDFALPLGAIIFASGWTAAGLALPARPIEL